MFFKKKKEESAEQPIIKLPGDLHEEWYQTILGVMKTAFSQPNCTMTPEQLLEKICPPGMFTEEERTKLLKEATEQ